MEKTEHFKMAKASRGGIALAAWIMLGLCLLPLPAQAMVVIVDLGWGWNSAADTDLGNYALQEGSIVQVIMFNSADVDNQNFQSGEAYDNFTIFGGYAGTGIAGEPYAGTEPDHVPTDNTVYNPYSVPEGHEIVYSTEIGNEIGGNVNNVNWYNIYESFTVAGSYDSLYIRVFGTTEFSDGSAGSSYWGISTVQSNGVVFGTWYATYADVTASNHVNYFEVIPEPGTLTLLMLGGAGLWAKCRRRRKHA